MKTQTLQVMQCPYCGNDFIIKNVLEEKDEDVIFGSVKCSCSEFPVVAGILIVKASSLSKLIVNLIEKGKVFDALIHCFGWEDFENLYKSYVPFRFYGKLQGVSTRSFLAVGKADLVRQYGRIYKRYSDSSLSFYNVLGKSPFDMYLKNRFSTFSFWSTYSFIPLLKTKKSRILDLGCGAGHTAFVVSKYVKPLLHFCADPSFPLLYLAKKYLVPNAEFICFDANSPLPFKNKIFSAIMMSDAFHYVYGRAGLSREMERSLFPKGIILLQHLHNSLTQNPATGGYPLTPQGYANLFDNGQLQLKILPETVLVESFLFNNTIDLARNYSADEINGSNAMIVLVTSDKSLFKVYSSLNNHFLGTENNLFINPIYEIKEKANSIQLIRSTQYKEARFLYEDYYQLTKEYIPEQIEINTEFVKGQKVNIPDLKEREFLMKRFILIDVPENYL